MALPKSLHYTVQFLWFFRTRTPPEGQYEYRFTENEYETCREL
jgi:hypothetical protein